MDAGKNDPAISCRSEWSYRDVEMWYIYITYSGGIRYDIYIYINMFGGHWTLGVSLGVYCWVERGLGRAKVVRGFTRFCNSFEFCLPVLGWNGFEAAGFLLCAISCANLWKEVA